MISTGADGNRSVSDERSFKTLEGQPRLQVSVVRSAPSKRGNTWNVPLNVSVTDPRSGAAVSGTAVDVRIGNNGCPVGMVISKLSGTTNEWGSVSLSFKTRDTGDFCAHATASAAGLEPVNASSSFTVP